MAEVKLSKILRREPVTVHLLELEYEDGSRYWTVTYRAVVDGQEYEAAAAYRLFGGAKTPAGAINMAAERQTGFGF